MKSWLMGNKRQGPTKLCSRACANAHKRGGIGTRTGTTQSDEAKAKMRKSKLDLYASRGYAHSPDTIAKISATCKSSGCGKWAAGVPKPSTRGPLSPNWRGGTTPENKKVRASIEYKEWRTSVFQRDDYTCVECGVRGGTLNADHIKPFCAFPELRFDISNGRTLCIYCHRATDTYGSKVLKLLDGNLTT